MAQNLRWTAQQYADYLKKQGKDVACIPVYQKPAPAVIPKPLLNKTETAFYEILKRRGYAHVLPMGITLKLAHDTRYTPDFACASESGLVTLYEVKGGFTREDAWQKLKIAASMFPFFCFIIARYQRGEWTETVIRQNVTTTPITRKYHE